MKHWITALSLRASIWPLVDCGLRIQNPFPNPFSLAFHYFEGEKPVYVISQYPSKPKMGMILCHWVIASSPGQVGSFLPELKGKTSLEENLMALLLSIYLKYRCDIWKTCSHLETTESWTWGRGLPAKDSRRARWKEPECPCPHH